MNNIKKLPLLPLRNDVVFPKHTLNILVGRKISINAVNEALLNHATNIIIATQKDETLEMPKSEQDFYQYGVVATIKLEKQLDDGQMNIVVTGITRIKLVDIKFTNNIITSSYDELKINIDQSPKTSALEKIVNRELIANINYFAGRIDPKKINELRDGLPIDNLLDLFGAYLGFQKDKKIEILKLSKKSDRLNLVLEILKQQKESFEIEKGLNEDVRKTLDTQQRDFLLREKMKAIQSQLGEGSSKNEEIQEIKNRLESGEYPDRIIKVIQKELRKYQAMPTISAEAHVTKNYIDVLLDVPWKKATKDSNSLLKAEKILNKDHYGLKKPKERIIEFLAVKSTIKDSHPPILTFAGPPGVGKTSLAKSIAKAVDRKFIKISLGGLRDESEIRGHRRTYVGAMPGKIIQAMKKVGVVNPVILLDEIDKMSNDYKGDPTSAMLEVLDPEQNKNFQDHYLEEEYDLSKVMFIATANYLGNIPRPLIDRVEIIQLSSYTELEKIKIAKQYLIRDVIRENGLKKTEFKISSRMILYIIRHYTMESGVRSLKRELAKLARKILVTKIKSLKWSAPSIDQKLIKKLLGYKKIEIEEIDKKPQIGIVRGLAFTDYGGSTLPIEVNTFKGDGKLQLTGSIKEVMKESAQIALGYVKSNAKEFGIDLDKLKKLDIHIHVPEGATPKDGPSAGVTFTTALLSALLKIPVSQELGMTGEITLRGKILQIGGLKEKSMAASRVNLKQIFIPEKNRKEIEDIPKEVKSKLKIVPVNSYSQIFNAIFK